MKKRFMSLVKKVSVLTLITVLCASQISAFAFVKSSYKSKMEELALLLAECREEGINTDYEKINYYTIQKFLPYLEQDTNNYSSDINSYNIDCIEELYTEAKENLTGYLNRTKTPLGETYKYSTGDFNVSGKSIKAANGRPIYLIGVGHGTYVMDDVYSLPKYGYNVMQFEAPIASFIKESNNEQGYVVDMDQAYKTAKVLERAEAANVSVCLLVQTHTMPDFLMEKYPAMVSTNTHFGYNFDNAVAKKVIADYLNALIPIIKDYNSLTSICIENEPHAQLSSSFYAVYFRDYLKTKYATIDRLNTAYGSSYKSFDDISVPSGYGSGAISYDWTQFQEKIFADHISYMKGLIRHYTDVPVHVKVWRRTEREESSSYKASQLLEGVGVDELKSVTEIAGTDEESYYRHGGGSSAQATFRWYDLLSSVYEKPVFNSEDHVIDNGDTRYDDYQNTHVTGYLWQSAMHGLSASTMWIWERSYTTEQFQNSILSRPDVVAGTGKVNYNLNRLAYQVNAFTEEQPDVAILYSDATRLYETTTTASKRHVDVLDKYYLGSIYAGEKVGFITDDTFDKLANYKVLIIPQVKNITEAGLIAIRNFVTNGGKVIIYENGISSISCDEHNNALDYWTIKYIKDNSTIIDTYSGDAEDCLGSEDIMIDLVELFDNYIPNRNVRILDSYGNEVFGVDWNKVEYNGTTLINLCNYNRTDLSGIKVEVDGKVISGEKDLITGSTLPESLTLKEMTPMLLQVGTEAVSPVDPQEKVLKDVVDVTYSTNVLKWKKGAGDTAYYGANIYRIGVNGNSEYIGSTLYTSYKLNDTGEAEIIKICAKDANGQEAPGVLCTVNMSSAALNITNSLCENGKCTVTLTNGTSSPILKQFLIGVFDGNNKLLTAGGKYCLIMPGESQTVSLHSGEIDETCTATILN